MVVLSAIMVAFGQVVMPAPTAGTLGLAIFTIGFWATGVLPEYLTSLAFFSLAMLFSVSPGHVVFSGFVSSVVWLVFGGLVLGVAIKRTGPGERIANRLALTFGKTYFLTGIATTLPAVPAVLAPLAGEMARAAAIPVETALMIQVIGFSLLLFPYQAPPVVLAIQMGGLKPKAVVQFLFLMTLTSILFLLPINFLWWRLLGWI